MNEHTKPIRAPPQGVWAPAITFINPDTDELDLVAQAQYFTYLSRHLHGILVLGTNAETLLLTREERRALLQTAREAVGPDYPIMAGVSGHSTKQVLEYIHDAAAAHADSVLVLPCAYFGKQTTPAVIDRFYDTIATQSPLPVVIYNFPGVCNGVDIESDAMTALARRHANIVGTKLTCASVGKVTRLAAAWEPSRFAVFGGQSDFLIGGLSVGSAGCIAAFANIFPRVVRRVYDLYTAGKVDEALVLHRKAAQVEVLSKSGIASTKYATALTSARLAGIEDAEEKLLPRHPYEGVSEGVKKDIQERMAELIKIEESL